MSKMTEIRWRLSEWLFRLSYRASPDKDAYDYVMRYGVIHTKERLAADHALQTGGGDGK